MNNDTRGYLATIIAFTLGALFLVLFALNASAAPAPGPDTIVVDGQQYQTTKQSGPVSHFETPNPNPNSAFTSRNTWTGNGSEHLPCPGGIHWIDNQNVLTISNCLATTTTTTSIPTTTTTTASPTTTVPETTTTTIQRKTTTTNGPESTTTTNPQETTTSAPSSEEKDPSPTTTKAPSTSATLPFTGVSEIAGYSILGLVLLSIGGLIIAATRTEE